jgi:hypothetical protein
MQRPSDNEPEPTGGRAAERLREFLARRLPPGASPDEINAEIAKWKQENPELSDSAKELDTCDQADDTK